MRIQTSPAAIAVAALLLVSASAVYAAHAIPHANETLIDFNKLRPGPVSIMMLPDYQLIGSEGVKIAPSADPAMTGQVLTTDAADNNYASVIFHARRKTIDLDVTPDPAGQPAKIKFFQAVTFELLKTETVEPGGGPRHLTFSAPGNLQLQGVTWEGGRLSIDNVREYFAEPAKAK